MQKILFAKLEVWFVLILFLIGVVGSIFFGALVLRAERQLGDPSGIVAVALTMAEVPKTMRMMLQEDTQIRAPDRDGLASLKPGWNPTGAAMPSIPGYFLLSRYDGTAQRHITELVSLTDWTVRHAWQPDAGELLGDVARTSRFAPHEDWNNKRFRAINPFLMPNGDLITKDHGSPLFRIDACSRRVWKQEGSNFHHSTEIDADGMFWVPGLIEPSSVKANPDFLDDSVVQVDPADGKILLERSITDLMLDKGYVHRLFSNGVYVDDPIHLNDIQPALADGPYWKKGDLFLSLRNLSAIMQYRPSTDEIVWMKEGPWLSQHDVDILDDHRIAVFDNRAEDRGMGEFVATHSDVLVYDFATDTVSSLLQEGMAKADIRTLYAGLYTPLSNGYSLIEDVTASRLVLFDPAQVQVAEYANKAEDGHAYHLGWGHYVTQEQGDTALAAIAATTCPAR